MFQGYTQGAIDFLWGLKLNNERAWFQEHKQEFTDLVDRPTRELATQLTEDMTEAFPRLGLELKVSRIYRDARRLFGRGPYKDHLWFSLRKPGEQDGRIPCFWFEIAPDHYGYGMGCWEMLPTTMAKLRARIDRDPKLVEKLALRHAIDALPERERMVILLRFYRNFTQDRVSKVLGVSQVQVSRIERRAVAHLREALTE